MSDVRDRFVEDDLGLDNQLVDLPSDNLTSFERLLKNIVSEILAYFRQGYHDYRSRPIRLHRDISNLDIRVEYLLTRKTDYDIEPISGVLTFSDDIDFRLATIDSEGASGNDSITNINGLTQGQRLVLQKKNAFRNITIESSGNISLGALGSFTLKNLQDKIEFISRNGSDLDALNLRNN